MDKKKSCLISVKIYNAKGSINKKWFVYYTDPIPNPPKRVRLYGDINKAKDFDSRKVAAEILRQKTECHLNQSLYDKPQPTIRKALNDLLKKRVKDMRKKSNQTYTTKIHILTAYLERQRVTSLIEITPSVALSFMTYLEEERNVSNTTYNAYIQTCGSIIMDGLPENVPNPFGKIKKKKEDQIPSLYFQASQIRKIKKAMVGKDAIVWLYCQFIYYCFIRPGELRFLKVSDVRIDEARILVRGEISKNKKQQFVNIPTAFLPEIQEYLDGQACKETDFLFGREGRPGAVPYGTRRMASRHQEILKSLSIDTERHKLYSWKHTGAIALARSNVPIKQIQLHLRHHSLEETDRYLRDMAINTTDAVVTNYPVI